MLFLDSNIYEITQYNVLLLFLTSIKCYRQQFEKNLLHYQCEYLPVGIYAILSYPPKKNTENCVYENLGLIRNILLFILLQKCHYWWFEFEFSWTLVAFLRKQILKKQKTKYTFMACYAIRRLTTIDWNLAEKRKRCDEVR